MPWNRPDEKLESAHSANRDQDSMITLTPHIHEPLLRMVCTAVDKRQTLPILEHVLIRCGAGLLHLTGSNTQISITAALSLDDAEEFELTLPAHKLLSILKAAPEGHPMRIDPKDGHATITASRSRFRLSSLSARDYPEMAPDSEAMQIQMPGNALSALLQATSVAQARNDIRYYLNGTLLELDGTTVRAVATDGHRLHLAEYTLSKTLEPRQVIVPRACIHALGRLSLEGDITISIGDSLLSVHSGSLCVQTRFINGRFPEYQKVIPRGDHMPCIVDRSLFLAALERCAILSGASFGVSCIFDDGRIALKSVNQEPQEEITDEIEADYQGKTIEIGFNIQLLLDALGVIATPRCVIQLRDRNQPTIITPEDGDAEIMTAIMPMRLSHAQ